MKVESTEQLAKVTFDPETGLYTCQVQHLHAVETFQTQDIAELRHRLRDLMADEMARPVPSTYFSSDFEGESVLLCLETALYLKLARLAGQAGKNLTQYIVQILEEVDEPQMLELA